MLAPSRVIAMQLKVVETEPSICQISSVGTLFNFRIISVDVDVEGFGET